jgi:predicted Zn-dependent protease
MSKIIIFITFISFNLFGNELPELGSSFDNLLSSADEKKIKFQIMSQVFSSNSVVKDAEINDYLSNLGNELIQKGTQKNTEIIFFILNDRSINAFAMLGNIIGVHTGLILAANNESELSSVLAHEIAHITQKHLLRILDAQNRNSYKSYLSLAIAILAARSSPQLANAALTASSASQVQNTLDYTREHEREADRIGLKIINDSGYDPRGFIDFFSTMQKFNNFSSGATPAFLRTHPITSERISDIQDRINEYSYIQKINKIEFFLSKAKLQAFTGDYSNIEEIFRNDIKMQRYQYKPATVFGLVYSLLRKNKTHEARKEFNELVKMKIKSPMMVELEAKLLIQEGKLEESFQKYKNGLREYPYYKAFIIGISNLLLQANDAEKVIELTKKYLNYYKNDSNLYELLAKAYNLKGNKLLEHESLSDYFYHQFSINDAISQMDIAVNSKSNNFYDQSRVEYRLKELKHERDLLYN